MALFEVVKYDMTANGGSFMDTFWNCKACQYYAHFSEFIKSALISAEGGSSMIITLVRI